MAEHFTYVEAGNAVDFFIKIRSMSFRRNHAPAAGVIQKQLLRSYSGPPLYDQNGPLTEAQNLKPYTHNGNFMTTTKTFYNHNAEIRPIFYNVNSGIAYDINGDGNT